jgi:hypothetical protein
MENQFYRTAEGSFIKFSWDTVKNNFLTEKNGGPVFDQVLLGHISSPGQQKSTMTLEFAREDINGNKRNNENAFKRYGEQVEAFLKKEQSPKLQGTPVEQMPGLDMKVAATCKALHIYTIEALADLNDSGINALGMGARKLKAEAQAYLESRKSKEAAVEVSQKLSAENQELREQIASLSAIVKELQANAAAEQAASIPRRKKSAK